MALKYTDRLESNNPAAYGIVKATEISGHRTVQSVDDLYSLADAILSDSGNNTNDDAIGQKWYVVDEGKEYKLVDWNNRKQASGWQPTFEGKIDSEEKYELEGEFDDLTADRAIADGLGNNIVNTYATKQEINGHTVPDGGDIDQVLTKTSNGYAWKTLPTPQLSDNYAASVLENSDLEPAALDTYETAISKLHSAILSNEEITSDSLNNIAISVGLTASNQELPDLSDTNYISDQTTIINCLKQLDAVLSTLSSKVSTVDNLLNRIQSLETAITLNDLQQ